MISVARPYFFCGSFVLFMSCICHVVAALWSPAGKELTSWLSFVMFNCVFVTFPCCILGQVWHLIVSIPDLCHRSYFAMIQVGPNLRFSLALNICES